MVLVGDVGLHISFSISAPNLAPLTGCASFGFFYSLNVLAASSSAKHSRYSTNLSVLCDGTHCTTGTIQGMNT